MLKMFNKNVIFKQGVKYAWKYNTKKKKLKYKN